MCNQWLPIEHKRKYLLLVGWLIHQYKELDPLHRLSIH